jgi:hypothetical protein
MRPVVAVVFDPLDAVGTPPGPPARTPGRSKMRPSTSSSRTGRWNTRKNLLGCLRRFRVLAPGGLAIAWVPNLFSGHRAAQRLGDRPPLAAAGPLP